MPENRAVLCAARRDPLETDPPAGREDEFSPEDARIAVPTNLHLRRMRGIKAEPPREAVTRIVGPPQHDRQRRVYDEVIVFPNVYAGCERGVALVQWTPGLMGHGWDGGNDALRRWHRLCGAGRRSPRCTPSTS